MEVTVVGHERMNIIDYIIIYFTFRIYKIFCSHFTTFCKTNILLLFLGQIGTVVSCSRNYCVLQDWFLNSHIGSPKFTFLIFFVFGSLTYTLNFFTSPRIGLPSELFLPWYSASSSVSSSLYHISPYAS